VIRASASRFTARVSVVIPVGRKPIRFGGKLMPRIDDYSYLWDGSQPEWVLAPAPGGPDQVQFVILNWKTNYVLLIEHDDTCRGVVKRMQDAGVRVLDNRRGRGK
jgi:hypothetical protein